MATISGPPTLLVTSTVSTLEKCKTIYEMRQIHAHMIKTNLVNHTFTVGKLIALCSLSGLSGGLDYAFSNPLQSIILYAHMLSCLKELNGIEFSLPSVLKACGKSRSFKEGRQVHAQILKTHFRFDPFVSNSVIRMYLEFGEIELARRVFDKMFERDVISWNSMITGYLRAGEIELACGLFNEMPKRDVVTCNAMIDGYGKGGKCELAEEVFRMMRDKDVVSWTSMISAYVLDHRPRQALDLFREMLSLGVIPDAAALVSVLSAIGDLGFVEEGKWIHTYISANKISLSPGFIASALIDMKKIGDWNSMISGLATHGLGQEALEIFLDMERMEIEPDEITFLGLLSACSHGGLLEDALGVIQTMPMEADVLAWKAILSASTKHGNVAIGENAAFKVMDLAPEDSSCYVLLSNIYAKASRWDDVTKVRLMMKQRGVRKIPGCSSILVNGKVHEFLVRKEMDVGYNSEVLSKIDEMVSRLKLEGYEPDLTQVLLDIEEEGKGSSLCHHSEKMALAFGLINIRNGAPIHIGLQPSNVVRDQNRFHHFEDGSCSCKGYW
ncbi:hypothetical protein SLA2020_411640 [Shorea laevis]